MKTRGLLFSDAMAQAAADGKKTQTRRVLVPQPAHVDGDGTCFLEGHGYGGEGSHDRIIRCPYGVSGDLAYVREAWALAREYALFAAREKKPAP